MLPLGMRAAILAALVCYLACVGLSNSSMLQMTSLKHCVQYLAQDVQLDDIKAALRWKVDRP